MVLLFIKSFPFFLFNFLCFIFLFYANCDTIFYDIKPSDFTVYARTVLHSILFLVVYLILKQTSNQVSGIFYHNSSTFILAAQHSTKPKTLRFDTH